MENDIVTTKEELEEIENQIKEQETGETE